MDFFDLDECKHTFDVICLCLVVNFLGEPQRRGQMIAKAMRILPLSGHLFLVLPLACVRNSRYFSQEMLVAMLKKLGGEVIEEYASPKLYFVMIRKVRERREEEYTGCFPKLQILGGKGRNNFHIVL